MAVIRPIQAGRGISAAPAPQVNIDDSVLQGAQSLARGIGDIGKAQDAIELRHLERQNQVANFQTEQAFQRLEDDNAMQFAEAQQNIAPSGDGFYKGVNKTLIGNYDQFLATVPENLRPRFTELIDTKKNEWDNKATAVELDQRNTWYRTGVKDSVDQGQKQVFNDPAQFDAVLGDTLRMIDASGLAPAEKEALRKGAIANLGAAAADRALRDDPKTLIGDLGVARPLPQGDTASILRGFEGFRSTPFWDVNHYRVGYGSDTITRADGTVVEVQPGMTVTREDAERDLARRSREQEQSIIGQVGVDEWAKLPPLARSALVSVGYNYGSLPKSVVNAVRGGNVQAIAAAVEGLGGDNNGVNSDRRRQEAALIRGDATAPAGEPAPQFAGMTYAQRLEYLDKATARQAQIETTNQQIATAQVAQRKDAAALGITTGDIVSDQQIFDLGLPAGETNTLLGQLKTERNTVGLAQDYLKAIADGSASSLNPYNSDDRALIEKAYDQIDRSAPGDERTAAIQSLIKSSGIVPQAVIADTRQNLSSNQVDQVAAGLQGASLLKTTVPQALDGQANGKDLSDAAATYDTLVNQQGLSLTEAAQRVIDMRDPQKQKTASLLETNWKQLIKDKKVGAGDFLGQFDTNGFIPGNQGPSGGVTDAQQLALEADWLDTLRVAYNDAQGNLDVAKSIATDRMKRVWGISNVSGSPVMTRLPPENFYPPINGSQDYIRQFAMKDAKTLAPDATNVQLVPATQTAADVEGGKAPRYNLLYQMPDGRWDMAPDLFQISSEDTGTLARLATEEKQINFNIEREFNNAVVNPEILDQRLGPVPPGGGFVHPKPATRENLVPDYTQLQDRLVNIDQQRQQLLGTSAPSSSTGADTTQLSPQVLESQQRLDFYKNNPGLGNSFTPMGIGQ